MPNWNEQRQVNRLLNRDPKAWNELFVQIGDFLKSVAITCPGINRDNVDDLVQEVYVRVLLGLPAFTGKATLRTWIVTILRNLARDWAKRDSSGRAVRFVGPDCLTECPAPDPGLGEALLSRLQKLIEETVRRELDLKQCRALPPWMQPDGRGSSVAGRCGGSQESSRQIRHRGMALVRERLQESERWKELNDDFVLAGRTTLTS